VVVDLPPVPDGSPDGGQHTGNYEDEVALGRWTAELEAYFRGERLSWRADEISPLLEQKSSFARRTIEALMAVPPGCTVSYGDLAALAGYPRAARAVGTVMSTNALPIVIPCHRVVRSDGSLGRYGTDDSWKERLLEHERRSQKKA
jgi:methylated-DNA-[protein]-cysteine S-methyltransferase